MGGPRQDNAAYHSQVRTKACPSPAYAPPACWLPLSVSPCCNHPAPAGGPGYLPERLRSSMPRVVAITGRSRRNGRSLLPLAGKTRRQQLQMGPVVYTGTSSISCAASGSTAGSNFVCAGALTFRDVLGRNHILEFSPTLRRTASGGLAIDEFGKWVEPETCGLTPAPSRPAADRADAGYGPGAGPARPAAAPAASARR